MDFGNLLKPLRAANFAQQFGVADWVWIIVFILVLILVWWLLTRSSKKSEAEAEELSAQITEEQEQIVEEESIPFEADDLTRIEGIGPKLNQLLGAAGIETYAQLADADIDFIDSKLEEAGISFANPGTWPEQAKLASEGKWNELERLQDSMKGGRKE